MEMLSEVAMIAKPRGIKYVITTQEWLIPRLCSTASSKEQKLANYQGSWLEDSKNGITYLFVPPLKQCQSLAYGKFLLERYITKITKPAKWLETDTFNWQLCDGEIYEFEKIDKNELGKKLKQVDFEGEIYRQVHVICEENYDLIKNSKPKVSKNSTGYNIWDVWDREYFDLTKLFVGAQGTLGLNIEAELSLVEAKKHSGLLVIYLNDINILPELINDVLKTKPDSFEAFDDHTLKLAIRFMPQFIYTLGFLGTIRMGMQFLPDLFSFAFKGVPKFTLLVEFESDDPLEIAGKIEKLRDTIKHFPIKTELAEKDSEAENYWVIRRESFNLLRKNVKNRHTAPFIDDFIIKPEFLVEFFPKLIEILKTHDIDYTIAGHMGDGNFHIIPLMDFSKKSERDKIPVVEEKVNQLVLDYHGSISAEHNEGLIRGYYLEKMYGKEMFEIFKEIKKIFDPQNIFNPHKKTDARQEYSLNYIRTRF